MKWVCCMVAFGIVCGLTMPAVAGDATIEEQIAQLKEQLAQIQASTNAVLEREVEGYLQQTASHESAAGGGDWRDRTTLNWRFTAVILGTIDYCDENRVLVNGDVDLDFDFQITENLVGFLYLTANSNANFEPLGDGSFTASGMTDAIGVDGTNPTDPGSITVYEAGIRHAWHIGDHILYWEIGAFDPRRRVGQNAFADDENTQFLNNLFDDVPSVMWLTDNTGRGSLGWHFWISLGADKNWTVNWGWFNTPGQWFNNGQFYVQLHYKGQLSGRDMNVRVFLVIDEFFVDATGDGGVSGGISWDWLATERIGVFVRISGTGHDANPVEFDASFGVQLMQMVSSRPDDVIGVALGFISLQDSSSFGTFAEDLEIHFEIYYRAMFEGGKLQISPVLMFVSDPNGGRAIHETLWILGLRIHVPF
ncbi:MAG: carbohydrate porin [Planctomycetaceae bacterium]